MVKFRNGLSVFLEAEALIREEPPTFEVPEGIGDLKSFGEIELVAENLRDAWQLGLNPIKDLIQLLEEKGLCICTIEAPQVFDACTLTINGSPAIIIKNDIPGDRQRVNLAHELGYLVLNPAPNIDSEEVAHRFASAFLIPKENLHSFWQKRPKQRYLLAIRHFGKLPCL